MTSQHFLETNIKIWSDPGSLRSYRLSPKTFSPLSFCTESWINVSPGPGCVFAGRATGRCRGLRRMEGQGSGSWWQRAYHELHETCHSVTFCFMSELIFWYWQEVHFTQYNWGSNRPKHICGKMHFLLLSENEFFHQIKWTESQVSWNSWCISLCKRA